MKYREYIRLESLNPESYQGQNLNILSSFATIGTSLV